MAIGKRGRAARNYSVRKLTLPSILKPRLDELSAARGALYSQVLTTFWRTLRRSAGKRKDHRRRAVFLSSGTLQRLFPKDPAGLLHSHSCDAVVDAFIASVDSARTRKKTDPKARFPRRRKQFFKVTFKSSAIRVREGQLLLSTGDRAHPLVIPWAFDLPVNVEIGWRACGGYELRAMYVDTRPVQTPLGDGVAGIDIGEARIAAVYDGQGVHLHSGRLIRARNHYANKHQAKLDARIARKKNGCPPGQRSSKRLRRLQRARRTLRDRIKRQNRDQLRKQARQVVSTLHESGVQTIAVGDLGDIRNRIDYGPRANQKLHAWMFGQFLTELKAQGRKFGLKVIVIDEEFTSQTCPWTGQRRKPRGRHFVSPCGQHRMDRDGVGAVNIRAKYLEIQAGRGTAYGRTPSLPWTPVLVGMAPITRGQRFRPQVSHAQSRRGAVYKTARIPGL